MARLATLKPKVATLRQILLMQSESRDTSSPWRKWYKTARWREMRMQILHRDTFTCRRCGKLEGNTALLVADHIIPHKGDESLFWSMANTQTLCAPCHNSAKQREERRWQGGMAKV